MLFFLHSSCPSSHHLLASILLCFLSIFACTRALLQVRTPAGDEWHKSHDPWAVDPSSPEISTAARQALKLVHQKKWNAEVGAEHIKKWIYVFVPCVKLAGLINANRVITDLMLVVLLYLNSSFVEWSTLTPVSPRRAGISAYLNYRKCNGSWRQPRNARYMCATTKAWDQWNTAWLFTNRYFNCASLQTPFLNRLGS